MCCVRQTVNSSWCTADCNYPTPNTATRKTMFRIRCVCTALLRSVLLLFGHHFAGVFVLSNANWLTDSGRVRQGDKIILEISDDMCVGSCLVFKRASKEWAHVKGDTAYRRVCVAVILPAQKLLRLNLFLCPLQLCVRLARTVKQAARITLLTF